MLKRILRAVPKNRPILANQRPKRFFSKNDNQEEFNVEDLFRDEEQEMSFNDPQVYFLNRNIEKMKRHFKMGYAVSGVNLIFASAFFYTQHPLLGGGAVILSIMPFMRARLIQLNLRKVVTMIELEESQEQVTMIYGANRTKITADIEDVSTVKVTDMKNKQQKGGFVVAIDVVDDLGNLHDGLQVYVHDKKTDIVNMKLLTKILSGDIDGVKEFKYVEEDL